MVKMRPCQERVVRIAPGGIGVGVAVDIRGYRLDGGGYDGSRGQGGT